MSANAIRRPARAVLVAAAAAAAALALPLASVANAGVTGPCGGSVTIGGQTYGPANDTPANPIVIPAERGLIADWEGHTDVVIKNHSGSVGVVVGPIPIPIADWSGENADDEVAAEDVYPIDEARDLLPVDIVGLYEVQGTHSGDGGSCSGSAMVKIEGNPLTTPVGVGGAVGTAVTLGGLAAASMGKGPKQTPRSVSGQ